MRIAAAAASGDEVDGLLEEVLGPIVTRLKGNQATFGCLFLSAELAHAVDEITHEVRARLGNPMLLGCTAEGVIGPEHEHEQGSALAVWAAHCPEASVRSLAFTQQDVEQAASPHDWARLLGVDEGVESYVLLLGDPFSLNIEPLLTSLNAQLPNCPVLGGMASGAWQPGATRLICDDQVLHEGAVGLALSGVTIDTVISQGCRPIGRSYIVTRAERNLIHEIGGKSPMALLTDLFEEAEPQDQALMRQGVFVGRVIDEHRAEFGRGDFLIRNVVGFDQQSGALAIGDLIPAGVTVQFHVRDASTADEDLRTLLAARGDQPAAGALLFSCNGRGTRLYAQPNHDLDLVRDALNAPPCAGFFCAGELGPVGGRNFIHGHTMSMAIFRA